MNPLVSDTLPDRLAAEFGIEGRVCFERGHGGFTFCSMAWQNSTAKVCIYGSHIVDCHLNETPILWLSPEAVYCDGKAIRGGIPICWPWFNKHPSDETKPNHGFARIQNWDFVTAESDQISTRIRLRLSDNQISKPWFDGRFEVDLDIELNEKLELKLVSKNLSKHDLQIGGAFHSYFEVGDIDRVSVEGLENCRYFDQLDEFREKSHTESIRFDREIDRVYLDESPGVRIVGHDKTVLVEKTGSRSTVVWNPWIEKARQMTDLPDLAYRSFLCVETANAFDDLRVVKPDQSHAMKQAISVEH